MTSAYVYGVYRWARRRYRFTASGAWLLATLWVEIAAEGNGLGPDDWQPG